MCQIIIIDRAVSVDALADLVTRSISANPDGCGIAWRDSGRVHYWRTGRASLSEYDPSDLADYVASLPRPVLMHSRWSTQGGTGVANAHPFPLSGPCDLSVGSSSVGVLAHNGHLRGAAAVAALCGVRVHQSWSDTRVAAEVVRRGKATIPQVLRWISVEKDRAAILTPSDLRIVGNWVKDARTGLRVSSQAYLRAARVDTLWRDDVDDTASAYLARLRARQDVSAQVARVPPSHPDAGASVWDDGGRAWWVCDSQGWRKATPAESAARGPVPAAVAADKGGE